MFHDLRRIIQTSEQRRTTSRHNQERPHGETWSGLSHAPRIEGQKPAGKPAGLLYAAGENQPMIRAGGSHPPCGAKKRRGTNGDYCRSQRHEEVTEADQKD
nr:MAG TPA: hypothetical protein [Caudoviricetes sp.]